MKNILLTITIVSFCFTTNGQETINWMSLNEAIALQKKHPKKIMMDVYTNWCGPCKMLDKYTFQNKDVVTYVNEHYYAVKFNGEGNETINYKGQEFKNPLYKKSKENRRNSSHEFADFMRIEAYPTIAFLSEEANFIIPLRGYYKPRELEFYLKLLAEDLHIKLTTSKEFKDYQKVFKPKFKS